MSALQVALGHSAGRALHRVGLVQLAQDVRRPEVFRIDRGHPHTAPRVPDKQPLCLKQPDRLPDGGDAGAEALGQHLLTDTRAAGNLP